MNKRPGLTFRRRACPRCGGDAYLEAAADDPDWRCLQCGRVVPAPAALFGVGRLNAAPVPMRIDNR